MIWIYTNCFTSMKLMPLLPSLILAPLPILNCVLFLLSDINGPTKVVFIWTKANPLDRVSPLCRDPASELNSLSKFIFVYMRGGPIVFGWKFSSVHTTKFVLPAFFWITSVCLCVANVGYKMKIRTQISDYTTRLSEPALEAG